MLNSKCDVPESGLEFGASEGDRATPSQGLQSFADIRAFVVGSQLADFEVGDREAAYRFFGQTVRACGYCFVRYGPLRYLEWRPRCSIGTRQRVGAAPNLWLDTARKQRTTR